MIVVEPAMPAHIEDLAKLLTEMYDCYGAAVEKPIAEQAHRINEAIFGNPPAAHSLLAWQGGEPAGFAMYSFLWPAVDLTGSVFLKELYVAKDWRRQGVGRALMAQLREVAVQHGCCRVEWTTKDTNRTAQAFYRSLGFQRKSSKLFYRATIGSPTADDT